jgi:hypothetical protein
MHARTLLVGLALASTVGCSAGYGETTSPTDDELVGGRRATDVDYPSAILIRAGCTAARVGPRHILTAAHCVWDGDKGALQPGYGAGDHLYVTTRRRVGVLGQIVWQLGGFRDLVIEKTEVPEPWKRAKGHVAVLTAEAPADVALIVLAPASEAKLKGVGSATIDKSPVAPGDPLAILGYGCEKGVSHANEIGENLFATLKIADVPALEPKAIVHPGSWVGDLSFPFAKNVVGSYLFTPGQKLDPKNGASICPGDSGAPVYRRGAAHDTIVGVNAYYSFLPKEQDPDGVSVTNWHTRMDDASRESVGPWLEERGATVEP